MAKVLATVCLLLGTAACAPPAIAASKPRAAWAQPPGSETMVTAEKKAWFQRALDHILDESSRTARRSDVD